MWPSEGVQKYYMGHTHASIHSKVGSKRRKNEESRHWYTQIQKHIKRGTEDRSGSQ